MEGQQPGGQSGSYPGSYGQQAHGQQAPPQNMNIHQLQQQQQQLQNMLAQTQQRQQNIGGGLNMPPQNSSQMQPGQQMQHQQHQQHQQVQQNQVTSAPPAAPQQNAQLQSLPIRAYLDQTVVPILLDGKFVFLFSARSCRRDQLLFCRLLTHLVSFFLQACPNWSRNALPIPSSTLRRT
jgi:hypothetical protein